MPKLPELLSSIHANPKSRNLFMVMFTFFCVLTVSLSRSKAVPWGMAQLWPVLVSFCGVSLLFSGLYHRKKPGIVYLVPAILLMGLGLLFLLFSFNIIPFPLWLIVSRFWPFIMGVGVGVLLALFFTREKVEAVVAAVTDETGDDDTDYP